MPLALLQAHPQSVNSCYILLVSSADLPDLVLALAFPKAATVHTANAPSDGPQQELQLSLEELHYIVSFERALYVSIHATGQARPHFDIFTQLMPQYHSRLLHKYQSNW